ncbi:glycosyltransferase family 2 protein [Photobacterium leiognathi]|uniref:glycosyltransferase family 2 protein n=1 Tax=Photobacterium leiognathi TaxID=553611 RepID=UPI002980FB6F|nr:glycosyltransferase family 2 protein [Photobacterium leiognathi]
MNFLIDIIIPAYNAEMHIVRTLNSIPKDIDVNIIIVDDGSVDKTKDVVNEYIKRNKCNINYVYQENKGEAGARNTGIEKSKAKYILFLDSDDELIIEDFEKILRLLKMGEYSILLGGYKKELSDGASYTVKYNQLEGDIDFLIKSFFIRKLNPGIGNTFFKSEIIKHKNIKFENYKYGADNEFVRRFLILSEKKQKILVSKDVFFSYNYNIDSLMNQKFSVERLDSIKSVVATRELCKELKFEKYIKYLNIFLINEIRGVYYQAVIQNGNKSEKEILKYLPKEMDMKLLFDRKKIKTSLHNAIFYFSPSIYKLLALFKKEK